MASSWRPCRLLSLDPLSPPPSPPLVLPAPISSVALSVPSPPPPPAFDAFAPIRAFLSLLHLTPPTPTLPPSRPSFLSVALHRAASRRPSSLGFLACPPPYPSLLAPSCGHLPPHSSSLFLVVPIPRLAWPPPFLFLLSPPLLRPLVRAFCPSYRCHSPSPPSACPSLFLASLCIRSVDPSPPLSVFFAFVFFRPSSCRLCSAPPFAARLLCLLPLLWVGPALPLSVPPLLLFHVCAVLRVLSPPPPFFSGLSSSFSLSLPSTLPGFLFFPTPCSPLRPWGAAPPILLAFFFSPPLAFLRLLLSLSLFPSSLRGARSLGSELCHSLAPPLSLLHRPPLADRSAFRLSSARPLGRSPLVGPACYCPDSAPVTRPGPGVCWPHRSPRPRLSDPLRITSHPPGCLPAALAHFLLPRLLPPLSSPRRLAPLSCRGLLPLPRLYLFPLIPLCGRFPTRRFCGGPLASLLYLSPSRPPSPCSRSFVLALRFPRRNICSYVVAAIHTYH